MSGRLNKKRKVGASAGAVASATITDPRFANIQSDPRYRLPGRKHKVKLDSRFSQALKDDDFSRRAKVDRYGRPLETDAERKRLKRKYEFEVDEGSGKESDEADDDDEVQIELRKVNESHDPLREGKFSDSSSSDSSSDEDSDSEEDAAEETELAPETQSDVPVGEVSSRLAVVNLDWDNIRAQDLMAVFSSFLDSRGRLQHVAIYPSEFGKERLRREEMEGPPKEIFANPESQQDEDTQSSDSEDDDEAIKSSMLKPDDGTDFDSQALRRYQLERLRYFYAILTFSSPNAAKTIYDAVDGTEYLSTANFFDLRFVPDSTDFSTDTPHEECSSIPAEYKPNAFVTDALQHSKVKLTWDAEDTGRKEAVARAFRGGQKEIDENDLKAYLGSDSSSSDSEPEQNLLNDDNMSLSALKKETSRSKMRELLGLATEFKSHSTSSTKEKKPIGNVQITFSAGLSGANADEDGNIKKRSVFMNTEEEANETTIEKYVRKERERKQTRRERAKTGREGKAVSGEGDALSADEGDEEGVPEPTEQDLGFDDPFFEPASAAAQSKTSSNKMRKEERLRKKKERLDEEEQERRQLAELGLLMADDHAGNAQNDGGDAARSKEKGVRHFNMRDIERAEKAAGKKSRQKNKSKAESKNAAEDEDADDFTLNTTDPRFASRLYENHEFAIDPTNPRYKGTKGMQALLEERRRRRDKVKSKVIGKARGQGDDAGNGSGGGDREVRALAEKIKRRK